MVTDTIDLVKPKQGYLTKESSWIGADFESPTDASAASGIPVRLPGSLSEPSKITIQPGARYAFKVNLARIRAILDEMGQQDLDLPQLLEGQTVTAEIPASVTAMYEDCQVDKGTAREGEYDPHPPRMSW